MDMKIALGRGWVLERQHGEGRGDCHGSGISVKIC